MQDYQAFIARKRKVVEQMGFEVGEADINPMMKDWQALITRWALRRGRAALFEDCGMGKTAQFLVWAEHVNRFTGKPVVVHCPIGVRGQTKREAAKFNIGCEVTIADSDEDVRDGINLVNYEKIHKFHAGQFGGVVLDESSLLKSLNSKTRIQLTDIYRNTRFKLACTATPSPNDHDELGFHAEWLGVKQSTDMRNEFFYHDSGDTGKWTLMGHAHKAFWSWVSEWAICIGKPSDINGDNSGYDLPELRIHRHVIESNLVAPKGMLFNTSGISATSIHDEKRQTNADRCKRTAELVASGSGPCIVWCDTNYEADELKKLLPQAIEVRGSEKESVKEAKINRFLSEPNVVMISKASIFGFGINAQHCNRMIFAGLSFSFESFYQAIRRCWRFGQLHPVDVHVVIADSESAIESAISRKSSDFDAMRCGMADAMKSFQLERLGMDHNKKIYQPTVRFELPEFLMQNQDN